MKNSIFTAFACVNLGIVLPLFVSGQTSVPEPSHTLRAMLLNVNTQLGDVERVKQVIHKVDPDILVLEEMELLL